MMTGKSVKDIDRYQAVLTSLLAREDNKLCADCESKGPRWASWNLGIFICIRCAGIHRNLGVHISKVKSVNLDQWTQEQIQCVQELGNAKAKRVYEAFLPECFQRPEIDQSVEAFIRDKYDKKKYMDKVIDIQRLRKEKSCDNIPKEPVVFEKMKLKREISPRTQPPTVTDLLVLDAPAPSPAVSNGRGSIPEEKGSPAESNPALAHSALHLFSSLPASSSVSSTKTTPVSNSMPRSRVAASVPENLSLFLDTAPKPEESGVKKLSKDSILSLYASAPSVHANSMAAQGLYMNQMGYPTHPYGSYHSLAQAGGMGGTMTASQMAMMGQQQSGMMGVQQNGMMGVQQSGMMGVQQNGMMGVQQSGMMGVQQNGMMGVQQNGMMGVQQNGMMGVQQNGMMGVQQNGMMGVQQSSMVGQQNGMMGAQGVMAQPSGVTASPYMPGMPQGMMGQQQNVMMGQQQIGGVATLQQQQQMYGVQQAQQLQWNITQMTQHMAGMNFYGTNGMMGYSGQHMGGQATPSSTHIAPHVWK